MALHRDIFWVGRQWAVTGHGMQAVDQKLKGKFDIETSRLWQDGLAASLHAEAWLNIGDFDNALAAARKHFPEPPPTPTPPAKAVSDQSEIPAAQPKPAARGFAMRVEGWPAKFVQPWRIRVRR
jgi:hypothetical protein